MTHHPTRSFLPPSLPPSLPHACARSPQDHQADVFSVVDFSTNAVLDNKLPLFKALPFLLGPSLRGLGILEPDVFRMPNGNSYDHRGRVEAHGVTSVVGALQASLGNSTLVVETPAPLVPDASRMHHAHWQWYRLHEAWKLLQDLEKAEGFRYDIALKLRFDATPLPTLDLCGRYSDALPDLTTKGENNTSSLMLAAPAPRFSAIHSCTDHMFYGVRGVMEVACSTLWDSIYGFFYQTKPMERPVRVAPLLTSLKNMPHQAFKRGLGEGTWQHFNKIGTLPYVELATTAHHGASPKEVESSLAAVMQSGILLVEPGKRNGSNTRTRLLPGQLSNKVDNTLFFQTEKAWAEWLINMNGIVLCDLGGGVTKILYKGQISSRPSVPCRKYDDGAMPQRRRLSHKRRQRSQDKTVEHPNDKSEKPLSPREQQRLKTEKLRMGGHAILRSTGLSGKDLVGASDHEVKRAMVEKKKNLRVMTEQRAREYRTAAGNPFQIQRSKARKRQRLDKFAFARFEDLEQQQGKGDEPESPEDGDEMVEEDMEVWCPSCVTGLGVGVSDS